MKITQRMPTQYTNIHSRSKPVWFGIMAGYGLTSMLNHARIQPKKINQNHIVTTPSRTIHNTISVIPIPLMYREVYYKFVVD